MNATDGRPVADADGIHSEVDLIVLLSADGTSDGARACRDEAEFYRDVYGGELASTCLLVQVRFDVAPDFEVTEYASEGVASGISLVTPDGKQIESIYSASGYPGTNDNGLTVVLPFGVPGSVLRWQTGSNEVGYSTHRYDIPAELPPVSWEP